MVPAAIRCPRRRSSPWIRTTPQAWFPAARRMISSIRASASGGLPGGPGWVHCFATMRRCHRRRVPGVTMRCGAAGSSAVSGIAPRARPGCSSRAVASGWCAGGPRPRAAAPVFRCSKQPATWSLAQARRALRERTGRSDEPARSTIIAGPSTRPNFRRTTGRLARPDPSRSRSCRARGRPEPSQRLGDRPCQHVLPATVLQMPPVQRADRVLGVERPDAA